MEPRELERRSGKKGGGEEDERWEGRRVKGELEDCRLRFILSKLENPQLVEII